MTGDLLPLVAGGSAPNNSSSEVSRAPATLTPPAISMATKLMTEEHCVFKQLISTLQQTSCITTATNWLPVGTMMIMMVKVCLQSTLWLTHTHYVSVCVCVKWLSHTHNDIKLSSLQAMKNIHELTGVGCVMCVRVCVCVCACECDVRVRVYACVCVCVCVCVQIRWQNNPEAEKKTKKEKETNRKFCCLLC